ncbi:MAG: extracellular solute-binding protein [Candidatus Thalassarchaeaceae archaeon]|jgi:arabinogalactan oligomer/maltooligosaccharide transport system permease protein|nr:extracellular solute-binding protein [Candidatus Thalassarchaeaceae archaeon]
MSRRWGVIILGLILLTPGCIGSEEQSESSADSPSESQDITLDVWYSFSTDSKEESTFMAAIYSFESQYPNVTVEVTQKAYSNMNSQFEIAAIGGQAPDLVRLSSDQLGSIGDVRVDGYPLLEDLRPHLTPAQRESFDSDSLNAMRFGNSLYGVPASQDCLSLIYNKGLFDSEGLDYPDSSWTTSDLISAAQNLTSGDVYGLAIPIKDAYWWFPIQSGFGGSLFDSNGTPTLDSNGSAESMDWLMNLEDSDDPESLGLIALGTKAETMKSQFIQSKAAMIVDGPWNWPAYEASRLDIGQTLLPIVSDTGLRMSPLVTYKGWSVSKQSTQKIAAVELALHLSSTDVQKSFALETYTMPTKVILNSDPEIQSNPVISGYLNQTSVGTPAPTTLGMAMVYTPLSVAIEQAYGDVDSLDALRDADEELEDMLDEIESSQQPSLIEGYRRISITINSTLDATNYQIKVDNVSHSSVFVGDITELSQPNFGESYDDCSFDGTPAFRNNQGIAVIPSSAGTWSCNLTGMIPAKLHFIEVVAFASDEVLSTQSFGGETNVADEVPPPPDMSPILFAIVSIVLSLTILLAGLRWLDAREGKTRSRLAHVYVAPALLALAVLTFYPIGYGIWLSFTDANKSHLGEESFVGLANFIDVFTSAGFLRVTGFTLIWTVANVVFHVGLGLALAMLLNNSRIRGRVAYRTALLLPWAIPSYISVLIWKGMLEPAGLINDLLGTQIMFLDDSSRVVEAQTLVILVNIWLGVPFMMMSLSGALQALPRDMYEAAEVDGIGTWAQFRYLTLPNLKSAIVPLSLLGFIWTFNMFNVIYLLTGGKPEAGQGQPGETDILITYVYDVAFAPASGGNYGLAAAWSVIIFLMLIAFSWIYMKRTNATEASA